MAVGGNFHAPGYLVNVNHPVDCSADWQNSFGSTGLVVGGVTDTTDTHVHGDAFLAGGGTVDQITELDPPCSLHSVADATGHMDFDATEDTVNTDQEYLASLQPNLVMDADGVITDLGSTSCSYKVMTLNTCNDGNCNVSAQPLSDPTHMFFGVPNWNGPSGDVPGPTDTVVINVSLHTELKRREKFTPIFLRFLSPMAPPSI